MIVMPSTLLIPDDDNGLAQAIDHAESDMNDALERGHFHRTFASYQRLKLLREERAWRAIGNFKNIFGTADGARSGRS